MRLFDLNNSQEREIRRLMVWHLAYIFMVGAFFTVIYYFGLFKSYRLLKEDIIFLLLGPLCTGAFIYISPWRANWRRAVINTYERLEGEPAFCAMAALVFIFGFLIYSLLIWGLGALGPSLFYM